MFHRRGSCGSQNLTAHSKLELQCELISNHVLTFKFNLIFDFLKISIQSNMFPYDSLLWLVVCFSLHPLAYALPPSYHSCSVTLPIPFPEASSPPPSFLTSVPTRSHIDRCIHKAYRLRSTFESLQLVFLSLTHFTCPLPLLEKMVYLAEASVQSRLQWKGCWRSYMDNGPCKMCKENFSVTVCKRSYTKLRTGAGVCAP